MNAKQWENELWLVSRYNFSEEVRAQMEIPEKVIFHDATLRDGEQSPGVVLLKEDKIRIAKQLDELGIQRIEAGMPAVSQMDFDAIKEISKMGLKSKIFSFSRAAIPDVEKAVEAGVDGIIIELTCGEERMRYMHPNWTIKDFVDNSVAAVKAAKRAGLYTVYFPYDTTRADPVYLKALLEQVCEAGDPDAVAVVDTTGTAIPLAVKQLVRNVKRWANGRPVEIHTHNDLGMGVANALAAVEAGAEVVHGCINGIGERCGNASLEQIILAAHTLYGIETGIHLEKLMETCKLVEELSGVKIPFNMPIAGDAAYMKESGIGMKVAKEHPTVTFPVSEKLVGATRQYVLGKKSGKESIQVKLKELGIPLPADEVVQDILAQVKDFSIQHRRCLTEDEFRAILSRAHVA